MPARLYGLVFPRRFKLHLIIVTALLSIWALILVINFTSSSFLGKSSQSATVSHGHIWNAINAILDKAISEHLAHRKSHMSTASEPAYGVSRNIADTIISYQDHLVVEEQTFLYSKRISSTRRKPISLMTSTNITAFAARFCSTLSSKRLLFVGSEDTFYLHSLWLKSLGKYGDRHYYCQGPDSCTFHHVCQSSNVTDPFMDTRRSKKHPTEKELLTEGSSIIRFSLSDSLYISNNQEDSAYTKPVVDVFSGVRTRNAYWLGLLKKADVVLMGRSPLPAPAWSYADSDLGLNWAYATQTYHNQSWPYIEGDSLAIRIIQAALHNTLVSFLPTTIRSLDKLQTSLYNRQKILVWHASWYKYARCSDSFSSKNGLFVEDLLSPLARMPVVLVDPWSLYHNIQVHIQNHLMRAILPQYGIAFLPMAPESKGYTFGRTCQAGNGNRNNLEMQFLKTFIELVEHVPPPK